MAAGVRRCGATSVSRSSLLPFTKTLVEKGLHWLPLAETRVFGGFAHRHGQPRSLAELGYFLAYARRREDLLAFAEAYARADHRTQGELLGYPDCCIQAFLSRLEEGYIDPLLPYLAQAAQDWEETEDRLLLRVVDDARTTPLLRYAGHRAVPHLPCRPGCRPSLALAEAFAAPRFWDGLAFRLVLDRGRLWVELGPWAFSTGSVVLGKRVEVEGQFQGP